MQQQQQRCVFRNFWICLLFSFGACVPVRKDQRVPQAGFTTSVVSIDFGSGGTGSSAGFRSAVGVSSVVDAGSDVDCSPAKDAHIFQMIADMLSLDPHSSRPLLQAHWITPQVPQGMVASRPVSPSSLIVHTDSDYQQAKDFPSDSKYTQDTFDHIPVPGTNTSVCHDSGFPSQYGGHVDVSLMRRDGVYLLGEIFVSTENFLLDF